ncbi:MAG: winged helix-turn-helix domain-containing protein [Kangiellaceae bacterium]|nr:winged helix-turn-helix domain-containing protein [Kangiellaceae bacterium]
MIFKFDRYQINTDELTLTFLNNAVDIEPAVLKIITLLIENREKVVTRDAIFSHIWSDRFVSDSALSNNIKNARKILGDDGNNQRMIKTIHSRGYQFVCPVSEISTVTLAVLPLNNLTPQSSLVKSSDNNFLGASIASHLISNLVNIEEIKLRSSTMVTDTLLSRPRRKSINQREYTLSGSYLDSQHTIRIYFELTNRQNNQIEWADSVQSDDGELFKLLDKITLVVRQGIEGTLNLPFNNWNATKGTDKSEIKVPTKHRKVQLTLV